MAYKTNLVASTSAFADAMTGGFGIVTVMNARIFPALSKAEYASMTAYEIANTYGADTLSEAARAKLICELDTLKIANVTMEGPTKTITGGRYSNPIIKFGKTARLEMQDALGSAKAIEALCGGIQEWYGETTPDTLTGLHFGSDFSADVMIIGDSFVIDRSSSKQVKVKIIFYQFSPDSLFNLTQDAEGDATVFDMNGDLLTTEIKVHDEEGEKGSHGVFYSIVDPNHTYSEPTTPVNPPVNPPVDQQ